MVFPRVRDHVELDELVALANMGLAEAAQRYEPDRGASFSTFAWYRVHGAIIDGLRRSTQLPRRVWLRLVALRAASEYLEHRGERDLGAAQKGVSPPQGAAALSAVTEAMSAIRTMYVTSLEAMQEAGFDTPTDAAPLDAQLHISRLSAKLRSALAELPERERALVTKHY